METITRAILLNTRDYKEADKLATLFSRELGKMNVRFVGVAKPKAKLKAIAQPFSLAEYELMRTGDFYKVKTAKLLDNYANILTDFEAVKCGYAMLETIDKVLPNNEAEVEVFDTLTASLDGLCQSTDKKSVLINFWLGFCSALGTPILSPEIDASYKNCYLDTMNGIISPIRQADCVAIDNSVLQTLLGNGQKYDNAINLLYRILKIKYGINLHSMELFFNNL